MKQMHLYTDLDYSDSLDMANFFVKMKRLRDAFAEVVVPYAKLHNLEYHRLDMWIVLSDEDELILNMLLPPYVMLRESDWNNEI